MNNKTHNKTDSWDLLWMFVLFVLFLSYMARGEKLSGRDIMLKHQESRKVSHVKASAKIATGGGGKKDNVKEFTWWRKLRSDGSRYNTLTRFEKPAEVRGQAILFQELEGEKNDIQMYLPAYKKVRRVESGQQSSSFMGSEFSYSDIVTPHIDDFEYKLLKEEKCPIDKVVDCYVIELVPAKPSVADRGGFKSLTSWVRKDNLMVEKGEYLDRETGSLWKVLTSQGFKSLAGGKWFVSKIKMQNVKSGRFTELDFSNIDADTVLVDRLFTIQNLQTSP